METCLARVEALANWVRATVGDLKLGPDFDSHQPLLNLGLTNCKTQILPWVAQGKCQGKVITNLKMGEIRVLQHLGDVLEKLDLENCHAAAMRVIVILQT